MTSTVIATGHYDDADTLWITFPGSTARKASSVAEAIGQPHRVVTNDDDDYASFGLLLEDHEFLVIEEESTDHSVLAYGIESDGHMTITDVVSSTERTYIPTYDRNALDQIKADYPNRQIIRWSARSVPADAEQPGALLVVQPGAEAHQVLSQIGSIFRQARDAERAAAGAVYTAVEFGVRAGIPETHIAKLVGIDRMTVRKALGKR